MSPENDESMAKMINQLDPKLKRFTSELYEVITKIKNRKAAGLDNIPPKV